MYRGLGNNPEALVDRAEIWVSLSHDQGQTWTEPRFVFANALAPSFTNEFRNSQCSYVDMFTDEGKIHLFVPHRWERALYLELSEDDLVRLPTKEELLSSGNGI